MRRSSSPLRTPSACPPGDTSVEAVGRLIKEAADTYDASYAKALLSTAGAAALTGGPSAHAADEERGRARALAAHVSAAAGRRSLVRAASEPWHLGAETASTESAWLARVGAPDDDSECVLGGDCGDIRQP